MESLKRLAVKRVREEDFSTDLPLLVQLDILREMSNRIIIGYKKRDMLLVTQTSDVGSDLMGLLKKHSIDEEHAWELINIVTKQYGIHPWVSWDWFERHKSLTPMWLLFFFPNNDDIKWIESNIDILQRHTMSLRMHIYDFNIVNPCLFKNIKELLMDNGKLSQEDVKQLTQLPLELLYISDNDEIVEIPHIVTLKHISLEDCKAIKNTFSSNDNIESMHIWECPMFDINAIPRNVKRLSLVALDAQPVVNLPESVVYLLLQYVKLSIPFTNNLMNNGWPTKLETLHLLHVELHSSLEGEFILPTNLLHLEIETKKRYSIHELPSNLESISLAGVNLWNTKIPRTLKTISSFRNST